MNIHSNLQLGATSSSLPNARLDAAAVDFVKQNATEDSDLGTIDGGNLGLAAYSLSAGKAKALVSLAKDLYPGAKELKSFQFNRTAQNLIAVVTSEDEPHIHLYSQSKATGACSKPLIGMNTVDLGSGDPERFAAACPGADAEDWGTALSAIFSKERYLDLGEGAAGHLWWQ